MATAYTDQEVIDVSTEDDIYVCQEAGGRYCIHMFKNWTDGENNCILRCKLKCSLAPLSSEVFLQIYNQNTSLWETVDSDNSSAANTKFTLEATILNLADYKDINLVMACRVYQFIP